ncbi:MAG TPA: inositol monophosphatase family protein [Candidatus Didemnitutus sp.]|nr:inositol monophosphatase family protein [Candidatus Didemnitutus sp.]
MRHSAIEQRIEAAKVAVMAETGLMHREFGRARSEIKHDGTKVTPIDLEISRRIEAAILRQFPGDQFFSEETAPTDTAVPVVSRFSWVLDPIDGTNNYINGIIYCAISLGLLERGLPVYGVIYDMARQILIHGGPGHGVWDGEKHAHARLEAPNGHSLIGFHSPVEKSYAAEGKRVIENFKIRGLGSSTLHLAYASIGLLDGVVEHNNKVWDIAAAAALIEEAGGELKYLNHSPFPLREFSAKSGRVQYVAGNPAMCRRLIEIIGRQ